MFTKAANIKPSTIKAHHPAFNRTQQSDSFIPSIQPKLEVYSANSAHEAEADHMADHVVSAGSFIQPTNFVSSSAPVQTSSEPIATQAPELDAGELADQLLPPMPGEDSMVTNEDAEPETNVEEEKTEKQEPESVEKEVKEPAGKESQKSALQAIGEDVVIQKLKVISQVGGGNAKIAWNWLVNNASAKGLGDKLIPRIEEAVKIILR